MAYTTVDICNSALTKVGERTINSIDDDLPQAKTCKARFSQVMDTVLSMYPFACALSHRLLAPDADYEKDQVFIYRFSLPADCLHIWEIRDKENDRAYDYEQQGQKLFANLPELHLKYARRLEGTGLLDHDVAELVSYYLAWDISQRLDPDIQKAYRLREDFERFFSQTRTNDSKRRPPRSYGPSDPFQREDGESPVSWIDYRL